MLFTGALEQDLGVHLDLRQPTGTAIVLLAYTLDQPIARDWIAGIVETAIALEWILSHAVDRLVDVGLSLLAHRVTLRSMFLRPRSWLPARIIEIYDAHRFEAATIWGQMWQRPYRGTGLDYLQVGSYESRLPGFLNTDHFSNRDADFSLDIRYPLPFSDARWTGIFAHHVVEHVRYEEALNFFREAHRILRPGGTLRIAVPDAEKFLRAYNSGEDQRLSDLLAIIPPGHSDSVRPRTALGFVNFAFYCGGWNEHRSAWDFETMATALREVGFSGIERAECGRSRDPKMSGIDTVHWADHSLYVEAIN